MGRPGRGGCSYRLARLLLPHPALGFCYLCYRGLGERGRGSVRRHRATVSPVAVGGVDAPPPVGIYGWHFLINLKALKFLTPIEPVADSQEKIAM